MFEGIVRPRSEDSLHDFIDNVTSYWSSIIYIYIIHVHYIGIIPRAKHLFHALTLQVWADRSRDRLELDHQDRNIEHRWC